MPPDSNSTQYAADRLRQDGPPVAELRGVSKTFGDVEAARDLDLRISPGEFLSFLGPSGCGKTTALRMLAGFEAPTRGDVLIDGQVVNQLEPHRRPVNMVFQSYALFPHLSVADNIGYGLRQRRPRLARSVIADKVERALETVRLSGFGKRRVWEMSGGQQQRVALARAIVNEPKLLLLDEPLAALDRKLRKEMQIELQDLQRQLGITFVLVTHDQEEALSLSDRICVMRAGRIVQVGSPQELYDCPASRYVADFVGNSNFFEGRIEEVDGALARLVTGGGQTLAGRASPGLAAGRDGCLSIRPEQIRIGSEPGPGCIEVTVQNRIFLGEHTEYLVRHGGLGNIIVLAPRQAEIGARGFEAGARAFLNWSDEAALILNPD
ncbi:ABC transporter ATP-binding protein [Limibaculum sp. M0105]|uniref:ABC transporter ATP-binding protein n=1 Tax=Thermohalobaculum xanthum TaxID=2753746 RepID=A0A8J7M5T9_9RHOB|nr:ABC transporter ATP-binding protein [Thermohalobaculum xanthum]MBK0399056.1 ABC transporter ATP-binding protein [Thermohalobaculum xanthum]